MGQRLKTPHESKTFKFSLHRKYGIECALLFKYAQLRAEKCYANKVNEKVWAIWKWKSNKYWIQSHRTFPIMMPSSVSAVRKLCVSHYSVPETFWNKNIQPLIYSHQRLSPSKRAALLFPFPTTRHRAWSLILLCSVGKFRSRHPFLRLVCHAEPLNTIFPIVLTCPQQTQGVCRHCRAVREKWLREEDNSKQHYRQSWIRFARSQAFALKSINRWQRRWTCRTRWMGETSSHKNRMKTKNEKRKNTFYNFATGIPNSWWVAGHSPGRHDLGTPESNGSPAPLMYRVINGFRFFRPCHHRHVEYVKVTRRCNGCYRPT